MWHLDVPQLTVPQQRAILNEIKDTLIVGVYRKMPVHVMPDGKSHECVHARQTGLQHVAKGTADRGGSPGGGLAIGESCHSKGGVDMTSFGLGRYWLRAVALIAMLSGCGGSQPPIGTSGAITQLSTRTTRADHARSWMSPDTKKDDLLYITYPLHGLVVAYTYPQGRLVGTLSGFGSPTTECADKAGNIYIVDSANNVVDKFAHGGTSPIATYTVPENGQPGDCSLDPTTGNLAVIASNVGSIPSIILVYPPGQYEYPQGYTDTGLSNFVDCGYDNIGNLFADGFAGRNYVLTELPYGSSTLENVSLDPSGDLTGAGPVHWDGKFLALGDSTTGLIYRVAVNPSGGAYIESTTTLNGVKPDGQFWTQGNRVIEPDLSENLTFFWRYPAGGSPTQYISGTSPYGVTVSLAAK
jgi:hypothetical protein